MLQLTILKWKIMLNDNRINQSLKKKQKPTQTLQN